MRRHRHGGKDTRSQLDSVRASGPDRQGSVHCLGVCILIFLVTSPDLETLIKSQTLFQHCTAQQPCTGLGTSTPKANLTLTTFVEGWVAINPPEHRHLSPQQSHPLGSAVSLLGKTHPVPWLPERGGAGQQPAPETLPAVVPGRTMPDSFTIHFLKVLRELLAFVLFSYTVLVGALLLAGWTTYFLVLK